MKTTTGADEPGGELREAEVEREAGSATQEGFPAAPELLIPLGNRIICRLKEPEKLSKGGIHIPDTGQEKPKEALVLYAGRGRTTEFGGHVPMTARVGDRVFFGQYSGTDLELPEPWGKVTVLVEDEVLAVVRGSGQGAQYARLPLKVNREEFLRPERGVLREEDLTVRTLETQEGAGAPPDFAAGGPSREAQVLASVEEANSGAASAQNLSGYSAHASEFPDWDLVKGKPKEEGR